MTPESKVLSALAATAPKQAAASIRKALRDAGNIAAAARSLSVSRSLLYRLMDELGVSLERVVR
jgi:transcriptional regulator of acetoin/glycerol metabolism